jgi:hypothetical protein
MTLDPPCADNLDLAQAGSADHVNQLELTKRRLHQ